MTKLIPVQGSATIEPYENPRAKDNPAIQITVPSRMSYYAIAWLNPKTLEFSVAALWYQYWGFGKKYTFYQPEIVSSEEIYVKVVKV